MSETRGKQGPQKVNIEELKQRVNGLDVWNQVGEWAKTGYDSIPDEMFDLLKWYGFYRQKPNDGHFMMRLRLPGGQISVEQARAVARISQEFGRDTLDITVRQNYQIHWLTIEQMPEIQKRLDAVGLTTIYACGDVPRTVVGCPLAGRDKDEIINAQPVLDKVNAAIAGNREFSNLPRKFKISISGCEILCAQPEIQDIGLYGAVKKRNGQDEIGFNLMAGGGLSTRPFLGKFMNAFVPEDKAVDVCLAITSIFRDMGNRDSRKKARMKFLVDEMGADAFRKTIIDRLGYDLEDAGPARWNPNAFRDHVGIQEQKQPGLYSMGFITTSGRIKPEDLLVVAEIAEKYGSGHIANTNMQNLLVTDIPEQQLDEARQLAQTAPTVQLEAHAIRKGLVVCTGLEFCNLAVTETKHRASEILPYLEKEVDLDTPLKIAISGCPNSCSQYQTADIGLRGGKTRVGGEQIEAFDIFVGSEMGEEQEFNKQVLRAVPADTIGPVLAAIVKKFQAEKQKDETFQQFALRTIREGGSFE